MPERPPTPPSFESALAEFEALVEKMERGDLSLEDSVAAYERGVALNGYCEQALSAAERKIRILTEGAGEGEAGEELRPFGTEAGEPPAPDRDRRGPDPAPHAAAGPPPSSPPPADGAAEGDGLPF